jgi:hypothetical protein
MHYKIRLDVILYVTKNNKVADVKKLYRTWNKITFPSNTISEIQYFGVYTHTLFKPDTSIGG